MSVWTAEDRSLSVRPDQVVKTAWVETIKLRLGSTGSMSIEAIDKAVRRLVCLGDNDAWPPPVGHWDGEQFVVMDGRHHLLACQIRGRERVFVAWLEHAV